MQSADHGAVEARAAFVALGRIPLRHARAAVSCGDQSLRYAGTFEHLLGKAWARTGAGDQVLRRQRAAVEHFVYLVHGRVHVVDRFFSHAPAVVHEEGAHLWDGWKGLAEQPAALHVRLAAQQPYVAYEDIGNPEAFRCWAG